MTSSLPFLWWDGNNPIYDAKTDKSANGMFETANTKWPINTLPELPGVLVWKDGHIGVYIGNGQVIESKGTKYGVIQTPLKGSGATAWTGWCLCPYIEYIDEISAYKTIIQSKCQFSHPQGVWDVLDKHLYAKDLYRKWAESYKTS